MYTYVVIDDEELLRKGTIKKISKMPEDVSCAGEAENGKAGIALIAEQHPDFAILDMQMPEMDGMALLPYLREHYPDMPLIVVSAYRDFDYIKQAISANAVEYILKPFSAETIQKCIRQIICQLQKKDQIINQISSSAKEKEQACYERDVQLLYDLIMGYHVPETLLTSKKLNFINDTHSLILLTVHCSKPLPQNALQDWLDEHGFGDLALTISGTGNENLSFIILFLPRSGAISDKSLTDQIISSFLSWMGTCEMLPFIGISKKHSSLQELHTAYEETSMALNQRPLTDIPPIAYTFQTETAPDILEWDRTEEFLFRIEAGADQDTADMTRALFQWYRSLPSCTMTDVKYHCYQLSEQCRKILNTYLKTSSSSGSMQNVITHLFTIEEMESYYLQFFVNLAVMISPYSIYRSDDLIEKIQIYLQRNLQKNLTQDFLASLFYMNRSYLSTLFRTKTGEKFIDYLNLLRVNRAKELLKTTDNKMYQISHAVGYDNIKYFFRVFKKYTGTTPEKYREQHVAAK